MRIVVFDDDLWMARNTENVINRIVSETNNEANCEVCCFSDTAFFVKWLDENKVDAAVLDISVPEDENFGIERAKQIRKNNKNAHIIFMTSNDGKIYQVFSGLIRPTQFIVKNSGEDELVSVFRDILKEADENEKLLKVAHGRNEYFLSVPEILSVCKEGRKTAITLMERTIEVTDSLASIFKRLNDKFIWVDKGSIINIKMIKEVNYPDKKITMTDGSIIYMSRNCAKDVKKVLSATV